MSKEEELLAMVIEIHKAVKETRVDIGTIWDKMAELEQSIRQIRNSVNQIFQEVQR